MLKSRICDQLESFPFRIAVFTEHFLARCGLEWHLTLLSAFRAGCVMHFSWPKIPLESATTASVKISHGFPPN